MCWTADRGIPARTCGSLVTSRDVVEADLARSGGQAVILEPATEGDREQYGTLE